MCFEHWLVFFSPFNFLLFCNPPYFFWRLSRICMDKLHWHSWPLIADVMKQDRWEDFDECSKVFAWKIPSISVVLLEGVLMKKSWSFCFCLAFLCHMFYARSTSTFPGMWYTPSILYLHVSWGLYATFLSTKLFSWTI